MPSQLHEALLLMFRNCPQIVPELLRGESCAELPEYSEVKVDSADLTEVQPAEYRADLVLLLSKGAPVQGIVVEVQLSVDERKRFVWPAYVTNLRARWRCPVCLLVVCPDFAVARWARKPMEFGCTNTFVPRVLDSEGVPEIVDAAIAARAPELAVLSAMAHGRDADVAKAVRIATVAQAVSVGLDADRSKLYLDLVLNSLSEAARAVLQETMLPFKYEYQSDFARHYVAEGRVQGRAALIIRQLTARFGPLSEEVKERIASSSIEELDAMGDRLLTAVSLRDALASRS